MTDVSPATSGTTASRATQPPAQEPSDQDAGSGTAISSDFETFLKMLTAQVQNQDPLNPLDSTDFAVQLATFSSVEQQVLTNDLLQNMTSVLAGNDLAQLAQWVGMEARSAAPAVFAGEPVWVEPAPLPGAARAELRVTDQFGQLWDQFEIPVTPQPYVWDGIRADGTAFPEGVYTFEVASFDADGKELDVRVAETYNRIMEAQVGANGAELLLGNGNYVTSDTISALRSPIG
ncbi:MAG: flagellar hook capping FlgD N-terminal domain-containing protein [Pseudomonadota bacterium]